MKINLINSLMWRAFNALYNHFSTRRTQTEKIRESLTNLNQTEIDELVKTYSDVPRDSELAIISSTANFNIFTYFTNRNLIDDRGHNRSRELAQAISSGVSQEIINSTILCIYAIRCKYVHGSESQIINDEGLFHVSSVFLSDLLGKLLSKLA